jgi:CHAT domain-containing protein
MVVYTVARMKSFAWVVRHDGTTFHELALPAADALTQMQFLRGKLVPDAQGRLPELTPAMASTLYQSAFAPLEADLAGVHRVFLVADGPLQSVPFGMLGAGDPAAPEWLARRFAFASLPSVSSLRALRRFARGPAAPDPFAGFGDPRLGAPGGSRAGLSTGQVFTARSVDGRADVDSLRQAPSLPETADEIRALSAALQGTPDALYLGDRATEAQVKTVDLARYRFLAFATHGVMAGELDGASEPGLVLTPPPTASDTDDGYLTASEVAELELNADWVLLSACNTAAGDGKPGAEGLSGLASAFLYAGSRALLVSNWPVASEPTRELVTAAVANYAAHPERGKPEALQQAMVEMMGKPETAHPFFWAPFVVVGD